MNAAEIFILDDSKSSRKILSRKLASDGFIVKEFPSFDRLMNEIDGNAFAAGFVDHNMPDIEGPAAIKQLRQRDKDILLFGYTGNDDKATKAQIMNSGADGVIVKTDLNQPVYESIVTQIRKSANSEGDKELKALISKIMGVLKEFEASLNALEARVEQVESEQTDTMPGAHKIESENIQQRNLSVIEASKEKSRADELIQKQIQWLKKEVHDSLLKKLKNANIEINNELIEAAVAKMSRAIKSEKASIKALDEFTKKFSKSIASVDERAAVGQEKASQMVDQLERFKLDVEETFKKQEEGLKKLVIEQVPEQDLDVDYIKEVVGRFEEINTELEDLRHKREAGFKVTEEDYNKLSKTVASLKEQYSEEKVVGIIQKSFQQLTLSYQEKFNEFINSQSARVEKLINKTAGEADTLQEKFTRELELSRRNSEELIESFISNYEPNKEDLMSAIKGVAVPGLTSNVKKSIAPDLIAELTKHFNSRINSIHRKGLITGFLVGATVMGIAAYTWWYFY